MSHHSSEDPLRPLRDDNAKSVQLTQLKRALLDTTGFRGAVGSFPEGQLSPNDEGSIQFGLTIMEGKVLVDFGTPVRSLGMTPQQACDLAGDLVKMARAAARAKGETVALTLR